MDRKNLIVDLSFAFGLATIEYTGLLKRNHYDDLARQLFRCGTSIGANCREAQSAESRNDFIHKMKIAAKEAEEAEYWILLCRHSSALPDPGEMPGQIKTILRILSRIVHTTRHKKS